jgi:hypothetical protein
MDRKDMTISLTYPAPSSVGGILTPHPPDSTAIVLVSLSQYYDLHIKSKIHVETLEKKNDL